MEPFISICLYAIVWLVLFVFFYWKNKRFGIGEILLLVYSIAALSSILFFVTVSAIGSISNSDIHWESFAYLLACLFLCLFPLLKYSKPLYGLSIRPLRKEKKLVTFFKLNVPILVFFLIENLYAAYTTNTSELGVIYQDAYENAGHTSLTYTYSWIGSKLYWYNNFFLFVWPLLFSISLCSKVLIKYCWVPFIGILCFALASYVGANRVGIVRVLMLTFIFLFLYKNGIEKRVLKNIKRFTIFVSIGLLFLLGSITLSRFEASNLDMDLWTWITLYIGEGPLRFSQYVWDLDKMSWGNTSFSIIRSFLGLDTFLDNYERREYFETYFGIPTNIFYTFIGDWVIDFGKTITILLCLFFAFLESWYLKVISKRKKINIVNIFVLSLFIFVIMFGFMYFPLKTGLSQIQVIQSFIVLAIIKYCAD